MIQKELSGFFENYLEKTSLFKDKKALQSTFIPENISHRDKQISQVANILAPSLRLERPSNLFIYGKPGVGKTLTVRYVTQQLERTAYERHVPLVVLYINCKLKKAADTEYRLIAQLARDVGRSIPVTGLPTDEVYSIFFKALEEEKRQVLLILDEVDQLIKKTGDGILYNLTRINEELKNTQVTVIGISNDLMFMDLLDPRVRSSLSEEEIVFPPYNALQIQEILKERTHLAFRDGVMEMGVIEKCSAYAAREHGDARRALELLRVAGEVAERQNSPSLLLPHIDEAEEKIERDRVFDILAVQPKQFQAVLYASLTLLSKRNDPLFTGEIYERYKGVCLRTGLQPLTQRRVSGVIAELDMLGIINAKVISKGRYGRTREITLNLPSPTVPRIKQLLEEGLDLS